MHKHGRKLLFSNQAIDISIANGQDASEKPHFSDASCNKIKALSEILTYI